MTFSVPQRVFDKWNEVCDYLLTNDNFSRLCTIYYPPIKEQCDSCVSLGGVSSNAFQDGQPAPFNFNSCVYCGGQGFREKEVTGEIRLRIYWSPKNWVKFGNINVPDAKCQVIGSIADLPLIMTAQYISLISEEKTLEKNYKLAGKPFLHGFGKTRYFVAFLEDA